VAGNCWAQTNYCLHANINFGHLFNEGSGTTVDNCEGTASYDGTFKGSGEPVWVSGDLSGDGYIDNYVDFDGSDDYIEISTGFANGDKGDSTQTVVIQFDTLPSSGSEIIMSNGNLLTQGNYAWGLTISDAGVLTCWSKSAVNQRTGQLSKSGLIVDTVYRVSCSIDHTGFEAGNGLLIINGVTEDNTLSFITPSTTGTGEYVEYASGRQLNEVRGNFLDCKFAESGFLGGIALDSTDMNEIQDFGLDGTGSPAGTGITFY
jgi:hypothetical protein